MSFLSACEDELTKREKQNENRKRTKNFCEKIKLLSTLDGIKASEIETTLDRVESPATLLCKIGKKNGKKKCSLTKNLTSETDIFRYYVFWDSTVLSVRTKAFLQMRA